MSIEQRVFQIAAAVLAVPITLLSRDSSPRTIPTWDPIAFAAILDKVARTLHVQFSVEQAEQMRNLGDIIDAADALVFGWEL